MRRFLKFTLAATLSLSMLAPNMVLAAELGDLPAENETPVTVNVGDHADSNSGNIDEVKAAVPADPCPAASAGDVDVNNASGVIEINNGNVDTNNGLVIRNGATGVVGANNGQSTVDPATEVETSNGGIDTNEGTVTTNNGQVDTNKGLIERIGGRPH